MENVIVALVCISVLVTGVVTITQSSFNSIDTLAYAWKDGESLARDMRNTIITSVSAVTSSSGSYVTITIGNDGNTALTQFNKWDVILFDRDHGVFWIPYTAATPGWTVNGIYLNGNPEIFELNIFNPDETMAIRLRPPYSFHRYTVNKAIISTPNAARTEITFNRP